MTSICMTVEFIFSHDESGEGNDDEFDNEVDGGKFIISTCEGLAVYSSSAKEM